MLPLEPSPDYQPPINSVSDDASEPPEGHLLIVQDDRGRHRFVLEGDIYSIGRDRDCDIRLFSQFVSRHHATLVRIHQEDGTDSYRIVDGTLEGKLSSNGLLINGKKLHSYELQNEEEIIFGPQVRAIYYRIRHTTGDLEEGEGKELGELE
ncbi:MAG TPA: phosphopeptide-binding protein [Cyanobacteria bacterium UBA8803]|nr:phosphopeptide-binding protein [Cyanobacteria bacterium UBA9273]HBL57739.1 phosphopeptide-binding protein [Cyanobacteria bacterium UBA8803]